MEQNSDPDGKKKKPKLMMLNIATAED